MYWWKTPGGEEIKNREVAPKKKKSGIRDVEVQREKRGVLENTH